MEVNLPDPEADPVWLERLFRLNAVIESVGAPLTGNLCYDHRQPGFATSPPNPVYRAKRDRFRGVLNGLRWLLEIGVNGAHSAFVALSSNDDLEYHGVDICDNAYVVPAVEWLKTEFPGRVQFHPGSSLEVLPALAARCLLFDSFHIDGSKKNYFKDMINSSSMVAEHGSVVVVDDSETLPARVALKSSSLLRLTSPLPAFPTMPKTEPNPNEIRGLRSTSANERIALTMYSQFLDVVRKLRALGRTVPSWDDVTTGGG